MDFQKIDELEQILIDILGEAGFIEALSKAIGYYDKEEYYKFICNQWDIEI